MRLLILLLGLSLIPAAHADGLFIHEDPQHEGQCFLTNAAGKRVFDGEYDTQCVGISGSQAHADPNADADADADVLGYQNVHIWHFRGQDSVVINPQGEVLYHTYWFDNGPDYVEDGVFRIRDAAGKIGYADGVTGRIVIAPQYACAAQFERGIAEVALRGEVRRKDDEHSICVGDYFKIDKQGKRVHE